MKQGNQFWYGIKLKNKNKEYLDISLVDKVVFNFNDLEKEYNESSTEVVYDDANNLFKIYLTQQETQDMQKKVKIDARVKFTNGDVLGASIQEKYIFDAINKEVI